MSKTDVMDMALIFHPTVKNMKVFGKMTMNTVKELKNLLMGQNIKVCLSKEKRMDMEYCNWQMEVSTKASLKIII